VNDGEWLARRFDENRGHLQRVAYRMLGSQSGADDAVQETWLRLSRSDTSDVQNLTGWLTTAVARVCLDMLRSHKARREESLEEPASTAAEIQDASPSPESETVLAESVGLALLVVLETLAPAERLAFVLHDMFDVPFDEIASIVGRSPDAARQLASRARRRVQGASTVSSEELTRQRQVVDAFLAAVRSGDFEGLVSILHPDLVVRGDRIAVGPGRPQEIRGARTWAKSAIAFARGIRFAQPALVNGEVGVILAPRGKLRRVLTFKMSGDRITRMDVVADPADLTRFDIAVLSP
jgi:RNA polymerase sigma factor (sigma-70 family)